MADENKPAMSPVKIGLDVKPASGAFSAHLEFERHIGTKPEREAHRELRAGDVVKQARRDGRNQEPRSDVEPPDTLEHSPARIERTISSRHRQVLARAIIGLKFLGKHGAPILRKDENFPRAIDDDMMIKEVDAVHKQHKLRCQQHMARYGQRLARLREDEQEAKTRYEAFRDKLADFGIEREPQYPSEEKKRFGIVLLVTFFVIESVTNGFVFGENMRAGPAVGLLVAAGLSAINMLVGFATGMFGLRAALNKGPWRPAGITISVFGVLLILTFNLLIAHAREDLAQMVANANLAQAPLISESWAAMWENPLAFDVAGLLLFGVGVAAALIGLKEGYDGFDDPIPTYGDKHRRAQQTRNLREFEENVAHNWEHENFYEPMRKALDAAKVDVAIIFERERKKLEQLRSLHAQVEHASEELQEFAHDWGRTCKQGILDYQEENRRARRRLNWWQKLLNRFRSEEDKVLPSDPPSYFGTVELPTTEEPDLSAISQVVREAEAVVAENEKRLARVISAIGDLIEKLPMAFSKNADTEEPNGGAQRGEMHA